MVGFVSRFVFKMRFEVVVIFVFVFFKFDVVIGISVFVENLMSSIKGIGVKVFVVDIIEVIIRFEVF